MLDSFAVIAEPRSADEQTLSASGHTFDTEWYRLATLDPLSRPFTFR